MPINSLIIRSLIIIALSLVFPISGFAMNGAEVVMLFVFFGVYALFAAWFATVLTYFGVKYFTGFWASFLIVLASVVLGEMFRGSSFPPSVVHDNKVRSEVASILGMNLS